MIWANGQLNVLPNSFKGIFFKQKPFSKSLASYAFHEARKPRLEIADHEDISVYDFVEKRFGEELAKYLVDPMCRGITAGDARKLSMKAVFGEIYHKEKVAGSVVRGLMQKVPYTPNHHVRVKLGDLATQGVTQRWSMWNLLGGLQSFPNALTEYLTNLNGSPVQLYNESKVKCVKFNEDGTVPVTVTVSTPTEEITIEADRIFSALPAHDLAEVLSTTEPRISDQLKKISSANVAVVCLEYDGKKVVGPDAGFGFLVPSSEKETKVLGITFDSCSFPVHDANRNITRLTVIGLSVAFNDSLMKIFLFAVHVGWCLVRRKLW